MNINRIIGLVRNLKEEGIVGGAPTNNVGSGHIAGAVPGKEPPVFMNKKKRPPILARGKMPGARTRWTPNKDGKY